MLMPLQAEQWWETRREYPKPKKKLISDHDNRRCGSGSLHGPTSEECQQVPLSCRVQFAATLLWLDFGEPLSLVPIQFLYYLLSCIKQLACLFVGPRPSVN